MKKIKINQMEIVRNKFAKKKHKQIQSRLLVYFIVFVVVFIFEILLIKDLSMPSMCNANEF